MDREAIIGEFQVFLKDFLKARNLELIEVIHRYEGRDLFLRILVDKPEGGISLGECALLNRELGDILDEKNILEQRYILEVSSPGLDRPLKTEADFIRFLNKKAKFFLSEVINGKLEWDGVINKVNEGKVYVNTGEVILEIPLGKINKAKLII
ncbi:MAG: ribosome maturation factor RimP [Candidatus Omnitrophota bacterium]|nr:ribosome maturation factor RimP [Candidatus Omnitrophota bacterium]